MKVGVGLNLDLGFALKILCGFGEATALKIMQYRTVKKGLLLARVQCYGTFVVDIADGLIGEHDGARLERCEARVSYGREHIGFQCCLGLRKHGLWLEDTARVYNSGFIQKINK